MDPVAQSNDFRLLTIDADELGNQPTQDKLKELANSINTAFLQPMASFSPLPFHPSPTVDTDTIDDVTCELTVFKLLSHLKSSKAPGPDRLPGWIFKENANILAKPITSILNTSYQERRLPMSWKMADITPLPKHKPVTDVSKHLRPISLTPILSKVAEEIVVDGFIKPAILRIVDSRQYGAVPKSSTHYALISLVHHLSQSTDGNGSLARIFLLDFRKAFDLIDHHLLVVKLQSLDLPDWVLQWTINFLTNRQQRVKLPGDVLSDWSQVPAGVPQGTKLGPWLYILMINDLDVDGANLWKYIDDITGVEITPKGSASNTQSVIDKIHDQSNDLRFTLNEDKCKELRIQFTKSQTDCSPLYINNKELELVRQIKVLGVIISNDLKWNSHVEYIVKKASKRMYFLRQLKRAKVPTSDMINFYSSCIRSVVEYSSPVYHYALPKYLSDDIERIQKRALTIICGPDSSYREKLSTTCLQSLASRRQSSCVKLFQNIVNDPDHKLYNLLPAFNVNCKYNLRNKRPFIEPRYKSDRFRNSFIQASIRNL